MILNFKNVALSLCALLLAQAPALSNDSSLPSQTSDFSAKIEGYTAGSVLPQITSVDDVKTILGCPESVAPSVLLSNRFNGLHDFTDRVLGHCDLTKEGFFTLLAKTNWIADLNLKTLRYGLAKPGLFSESERQEALRRVAHSLLIMDLDEAIVVLEKLDSEDLSQELRHHLTKDLLYAYLAIGDRAKALDYLQKSREDHSTDFDAYIRLLELGLELNPTN